MRAQMAAVTGNQPRDNGPRIYRKQGPQIAKHDDVGKLPMRLLGRLDCVLLKTVVYTGVGMAADGGEVSARGEVLVSAIVGPFRPARREVSSRCRNRGRGNLQDALLYLLCLGRYRAILLS